MGDGGELELPHDIAAERKVLSAMLDGPYGVDTAAELLLPEDFYRPAHAVLYRAMVELRLAGEAVDVETVRDWVAAAGELTAVGGQARAGVYLLEVAGLHVSAALVHSYARIVSDRAVRRRWIQAAARIGQLAWQLGDVGELNGLAAAEAAAAEVFAGDMPGAVRLQTPSQLAASDRGKAEPLIPGLDGKTFLARGDRVVTVGGPGSGKTVLAYQVAAAAAVGRHPFQEHRFDPCRILVIDLEMPTYLFNSNIELVFRAARQYGNPEFDGRFQVFHRPRGLDLSQAGNRQLLTGLIRNHRADIIVGGPVYKMHSDRGERADHTTVMDYWDEIRDRFGVALWLETHPAKAKFGKRTWEPSGSSRWSDWPEVGFAMVPDKDDTFEVRMFRGMRDRTRPWPEKLQQSKFGGWPWSATWPPGTLGGM